MHRGNSSVPKCARTFLHSYRGYIKFALKHATHLTRHIPTPLSTYTFSTKINPTCHVCPWNIMCDKHSILLANINNKCRSKTFGVSYHHLGFVSSVECMYICMYVCMYKYLVPLPFPSFIQTISHRARSTRALVYLCYVLHTYKCLNWNSYSYIHICQSPGSPGSTQSRRLNLFIPPLK